MPRESKTKIGADLDKLQKDYGILLSKVILNGNEDYKQSGMLPLHVFGEVYLDILARKSHKEILSAHGINSDTLQPISKPVESIFILGGK